MPCDCAGYPEPRAQTAEEQRISLARHHRAVEAEVEKWRDVIPHIETLMERLGELFPSVELPSLPPIPDAAGSWTPTTYYSHTGEFPNSIEENTRTRGWLKTKDFQTDERIVYDRLKAKFEPETTT